MWKRACDIAISAVALAVLAAPMLILMAVLRLTGEGEVFFVQPRVGRGGRTFGLVKFVTMLKASPTIGTRTITLKDDPRVLPVGRLLRRTKLNELPQLWNVLRGDMSLVGPRPLTEENFAMYPPEVQRRIAQVRPGLTGLGSVVFHDEESFLAGGADAGRDRYRRLIAPYKGALEVWYADHRGLGLDVKLVLLTAWVVLGGSDALCRRWLPGLPPPPAELAV